MAAVAVSYAVAVSGAKAASWPGTCEGAVCNYRSATAHVQCLTFYNGDGTKTWIVRVTASLQNIGYEALSVRWRVRAGNAGAAAHYAASPRFFPVNTDFSYVRIAQDGPDRVPADSRPRWVRVKVQFALRQGGVWIYSPKGEFETPRH
jgi:hypothetical protein